MTNLIWTATADTTTGARKHTATPANNVTILVWRNEPGSWCWEINDTAAAQGAPTAAQAKADAAAWYAREGRVRRCRVMRLGYMTTMLVRSGGSTDTAEEFAITRDRPAAKATGLEAAMVPAAAEPADTILDRQQRKVARLAAIRAVRETVAAAREALIGLHETDAGAAKGELFNGLYNLGMTLTTLDRAADNTLLAGR